MENVIARKRFIMIKSFTTKRLYLPTPPPRKNDLIKEFLHYGKLLPESYLMKRKSQASYDVLFSHMNSNMQALPHTDR